MKYPDGCFSDALSTIKYLCDAAYAIQYWANENLSSEVRKLVIDVVFYFNAAHAHYRHDWGKFTAIIDNYKKGIELLDKCGWLVGSGKHKVPSALIEVLTALNTIAKDNFIYVERMK